jgi:hypothetical protein
VLVPTPGALSLDALTRLGSVRIPAIVIDKVVAP